MTDIDETERQQQVKRNIRRTGAVLWLIVAAIFVFVIAKYYMLSKQ